MHKIKDEAKLHHMQSMSDEQRELMARAGTVYSEEQQRAQQQQQQALDAAREVAAQQAAAVATLQKQHRQHAEQEARKLQHEAEQTKAAAYVQMQQLAMQKQQQEEAYMEAERKAAEQLAVLQQEAAVRTQQRAALQEAMYVQELQLQQKTEEQMYWQQQQQQQWQDTLIDQEPPAVALRKPAATTPTVRQSPVSRPEFNKDLACTAMTADFAHAYLHMEGQQHQAAQAARAAPAWPIAPSLHTAPCTAMPAVAPSPRATPFRDAAWDTHVADQAYERGMEEVDEDVRMASPAKVEFELRKTTTQLAGHGQAEEQDIDWAGKAQQLEALLKKCQSRAAAAAAAAQATTTPQAKTDGPTPATSALPKRNLASQFLRVASQIQVDAAEQDYDADKEDDERNLWTSSGHKRKFNHDQDWAAPPKAMPKCATTVFGAAGLPVPPPPLTQEEFEQKMQEIAASIPAPPAPPKAAKSGMPPAPKGLAGATTKATMPAQSGSTRNKLLKEFVQKVYQPDNSYDDNKGRLEALFRLKQVSKSWKTGKSGYEWQTEEELKDRGWSEQGTERLQELEQLMEETGCFTGDFDLSLGDCLDLTDNEEDEQNGKDGKGGGQDGNSKKAKGSGLPPLDGSESVDTFVSKYKKTLLNKRGLLKEAKERLEKEACTTHRLLTCKLACNM
ncbi:unnamed protein product [Symbiodinium sp. CCMP2592]|nr:unnamed protein product [Symbiodinium sp. CCMP2592]